MAKTVHYSRALEPAPDSNEVLARTIERLRKGDVLLVPTIIDICERTRDLAAVLGLIRDHGASLVVESSSQREGESFLTAWRRDIAKAHHRRWWGRHKRRHGIEPKPRGQSFKASIAKAHELKERGHSVTEIAEVLGTCDMTIYRYLSRARQGI